MCIRDRFDIFGTTIEGVSNLNPTKKARRNIYLTESRNSEDRKQLKKRLQYWLDLLSNGADIPSMIKTCEEKSVQAKALYAKNIAVGLNTTSELERAYRTVDSFFKNTGLDKIKNVHFMNASREQITDLSNPIFIEKVRAELNHCYNRLDLSAHYSLLVIPGYLEKNSTLDCWAEIAHNHKVTLITDFRHLNAPDDVIDLFMDAKHTSADAFKTNVLMTSNWLVGRAGYSELYMEEYPDLGVENPLFIPPSAALAGKIYTSNGTMAQVQAGNKFGKLKGVDGVAFDILKTEIAQMESIGLIPMVNEHKMVMAFSAKTLFNGDNLGLKNYPIVRTFDWVTKVLIDFLNRSAFQNFNKGTENRLKSQIGKFLNSIQGNGKLIKSFKILDLSQDPNDKNTINLKIHLTPFFAAKNFMLSMSGTDGGDGAPDWNSDVN